MNKQGCQRCGVSPAPYFTEDYEPLTQEHRVIWLCADCMWRLVRIHDLFLKGADEPSRVNMDCYYISDYGDMTMAELRQ